MPLAIMNSLLSIMIHESLHDLDSLLLLKSLKRSTFKSEMCTKKNTLSLQAKKNNNNYMIEKNPYKTKLYLIFCAICIIFGASRIIHLKLTPDSKTHFIYSERK